MIADQSSNQTLLDLQQVIVIKIQLHDRNQFAIVGASPITGTNSVSGGEGGGGGGGGGWGGGVGGGGGGGWGGGVGGGGGVGWGGAVGGGGGVGGGVSFRV